MNMEHRNAVGVRTEYALRIDCAANGCVTAHGDDGQIVPLWDELDRPTHINNHVVTKVQRTVTVTEWVDAP